MRSVGVVPYQRAVPAAPAASASMPRIVPRGISEVFCLKRERQSGSSFAPYICIDAKSAVGSVAGLEIETGVAAGIGLLLWWSARHRRPSCGTAAMGCCCMNPDGAHVGGGESNTSGNSLLGKPPTDLVFKAVLADERATQEFLAFTQAEFSSENLEFYLARPCGHT